jgi:hypothetical protein
LISDQQQRRFADAGEARFDQFACVLDTELETEVVSRDGGKWNRSDAVQCPWVAEVLE